MESISIKTSILEEKKYLKYVSTNEYWAFDLHTWGKHVLEIDEYKS
jgi:hypothetical protein